MEAQVSTGASVFESAYDTADGAWRARRYKPPSDGTHQNTECEQRLISLSGLRNHLRAHQQKHVAERRIEGEEDVVIEIDGHP